jgi:ArsR family metal-binding transcriptional regulator
MPKQLTTFPHIREYDAFISALNRLSLDYEIITPPEEYRSVSVPAVVMTEKAKSEYFEHCKTPLFFSGWVNHNGDKVNLSSQVSKDEEGEGTLEWQDVFGSSRIMVLGPCLADSEKLRLIAPISGDITEVLPFINGALKNAVYNQHANYLIYSEGYRRITLFSQKITLAKVDDIYDAWRLLESVRRLVNDTWNKRDSIEPLFTSRKKPVVIEIYKHLPKTNCRECGCETCLAFAVKLHSGDGNITQCRPVFEGEFIHLQTELLEVSAGL